MQIRVGEIIKEKRKEKNYDLAGFAKIIGISPGYLSQLENGRKENPKLDIVLKIIKELEIDLDMLLGLDAEKPNLNIKIPSLMKLTLVKDRNARALEDRDVLKKICSLLDKMLDSKYSLENPSMYGIFLEDVGIYMDTLLKRYSALRSLNV